MTTMKTFLDTMREEMFNETAEHQKKCGHHAANISTAVATRDDGTPEMVLGVVDLDGNVAAINLDVPKFLAMWCSVSEAFYDWLSTRPAIEQMANVYTDDRFQQWAQAYPFRDRSNLNNRDILRLMAPDLADILDRVFQRADK